MSTKLNILGVLAAVAALSACGTTDVERAATGAAMGGALAAATDGSLAQGALYGAALGAISCNVAPGAPNCY